jgi:hypothetical protein
MRAIRNEQMNISNDYEWHVVDLAESPDKERWEKVLAIRQYEAETGENLGDDVDEAYAALIARQAQD